MKKTIQILIICIYSSAISQNNIIPNYNFENGTNPYVSGICSSVEGGLNTHLDNWKVSLNGNQGGNPATTWKDFSVCTWNIANWNNSICSNIFGGVNTSNKAVKMVRNNDHPNNCNKSNKDHIAVALENGQKFTQAQDYIIRYK